MSVQIKSQFKIERWEETLFSQDEKGPDLIRASVSQTYSGKIEGTGKLEYLITTLDESFSRFIGIEQVVGELEGRSGSFVLNHKGVFENGIAKSDFQIEPGSGTGALEGIRGEGNFEATHEQADLMLEYDFE